MVNTSLQMVLTIARVASMMAKIKKKMILQLSEELNTNSCPCTNVVVSLKYLLMIFTLFKHKGSGIPDKELSHLIVSD